MAIGTLALGIAAATSIFVLSVLTGVLSGTLPAFARPVRA
jgi:hypothetical protein